VLATAVRLQGEPPCRVGQKLLMGANGPLAGTLGCAEFDAAAAADAPGTLAARAPVTRTYHHDLGSIDVLLEPVVRRPILAVFSATPVAIKLLQWAPALGYEPVLVEPRPGRLTTDYRDAGRTAAGLDELVLDEEAAAVHTDHEAPGVAESVAELLRSPARFIGVMGSARHVGKHLDRLREMGFGDQDLARIRTPVGIDLGARTAEEIALSILAGVVADRRGRAGGWLDRR
jgi:xanthine dehydrogenase accessory factor